MGYFYGRFQISLGKEDNLQQGIFGVWETAICWHEPPCVVLVARGDSGAASSHINNLALVGANEFMNRTFFMQTLVKKNPVIVCRVTCVHVHVVCLCVNTPVSVTCFLLFVVETQTIFLSTKFNVVSVIQKEQSISEIP